MKMQRAVVIRSLTLILPLLGALAANSQIGKSSPEVARYRNPARGIHVQ